MFETMQIHKYAVVVIVFVGLESHCFLSDKIQENVN